MHCSHNSRHTQWTIVTCTIKDLYRSKIDATASARRDSATRASRGKMINNVLEEDGDRGQREMASGLLMQRQSYV